MAGDNRASLRSIDLISRVITRNEWRESRGLEKRAKSVDFMDLIAERIEAMPPRRTEVVKCPHCHGAKPADDICPYCELG